MNKSSFETLYEHLNSIIRVHCQKRDNQLDATLGASGHKCPNHVNTMFCVCVI